MGSCLSKKSEVNSTAVVELQEKSVSLPDKVGNEAPEKVTASLVKLKTEQKKTEDEDTVRKEICVSKHRKSHDNQMQQEQKESVQMPSKVDNLSIGTPVRTSSCTREEVDAILIQCGRLSRSSSANTPAKKKYTGSKRSYDFDAEGIVSKDEENEIEKRRQSRSRSSPSKPGRRRTPSRERDSSQQRSGSRERSIAGSGRRVSRSPGRRSDTPVVSKLDTTNGVTKPAKLVSVPASLTSSIATGNEQNNVKKIVVKRDVRSPRSQSPAQVRQPPPTLSRSNSRKTDQSPYRRNPLTEIDNNHSSQALRKPNQNLQGAEEGANRSLSNKRPAAAGVAKAVVQQPNGSQTGTVQPKLNRTKSLSRSRDFDELNRGLNQTPNANASSYASILLEDIQTFHQNCSNNNVTFTLPQCVTKACSIMDAVADLNSTTSSSAVSNDEKKRVERMTFETKELAVSDDLMEPSLHKYVTMRRGGVSGGDIGDDESSGSNSVAGGGQQLWGSPLETNSVDSTGCLTSKASKPRPFEPSRIQIRS